MTDIRNAQEEFMSERSKAPEGQTPFETQSAEIVFQTRRASLRLGVRVSPSGLLAIGGLVSSILLSTSVLVWTATTAARRNQGMLRLRR